MTELQTFIKKHPKSWEEKLSSPPYNLSIKRESGSSYILFKYNQIKSDMSLQICRESRGIILDEYQGYKVVCRAFDKFFNVQEELASSIDWSSAKVQSKIDGSILKLWWNAVHGEWHLSTNGSFDAYFTEVMFPTSEIKTFGAMFNKAAGPWFSKNVDRLIPTMTYIFEIVGPHNRIVVPYPEIDIYHIGTRANDTGIEYDVDIGLQKPELFDFQNEEAVLAMAKELDYHNEGFVVVDKDWNRVKIKSEDYVRVHRLRGETIPTPRRIIDIVRNDGSDDFLSYFPEYKDQFSEVQSKYYNLLVEVKTDIDRMYFDGWDLVSKKEFAVDFAKNCRVPDIMFQINASKMERTSSAIDEYFRSMQIDKLSKLLNL